MNVLIIGASRGIGLETVKATLAAGHTVRAFARSANTIELDHPSLEKVPGDALDEEALARVTDGCDAVIQTIGLPVNRQTLFNPVDIAARATAVMLRVMTARGTRRLIALTGFGAGRSKQAMSRFERLGHGAILGRIYADKGQQEQLIIESDRDWTIVRPTILTNRPARGRYQVLLEPAEWRNGFISRADVGAFLVRALQDDTLVGRDPVITN